MKAEDKQAVDKKAIVKKAEDNRNREIVAAISDEEREEAKRMLEALLANESNLVNRLIKQKQKRGYVMEVFDTDTFLERRAIQFANHPCTFAALYWTLVALGFAVSTIFFYLWLPLFVYIIFINIYCIRRIRQHHAMIVFLGDKYVAAVLSGLFLRSEENKQVPLAQEGGGGVYY
jgi:hypothetical protein